MKEVFKNSSFILLWLSQVFTQLGANTLTFVLALRVFELTNSNTAVGLLMLAFGLPTFIFGLSAGILADKFNKIRIIFLVDVVLFLLLISFFFASESLSFVFLLVFFFSLVLQFFFPSVASLIPTLVKPDQLLSANSLFTMTFYITVIFGYVLAGPLLRVFGQQNIFLFISLYFFLSALFIRRIGFATTGKISQMLAGLRILNPFLESGVFVEMLGSFPQTVSLVLGNTKIRRSLFLLIFSQLVITILLSLSPGFAATVLKIDVAQASIYVVLPAAVGMLFGSIFLGFFGKRWSRLGLNRVGLLSIFICLMVISVVQKIPLSPLLVSFLTILIFGLANTLLEIPSNTTLQEESQQYRGRVYGLLGTLVYGVSFLPLILLGLVADRLGVSFVIFGVSLSTLTVLLFFL